MNYSSLDDCSDLVGQLTSITTKFDIVEQKLLDSAARASGALVYGGTTYTSGATVYRPYYVSARLLQQNRTDQTFKVADGATFTNLETMIQSLMNEQLGLDTAMGLIVPPGYAAVVNPDSIVSSALLLGGSF